MSSYVGFANLPNQVHRKTVKRGFEFTLLVVGKFISNYSRLRSYVQESMPLKPIVVISIGSLWLFGILLTYGVQVYHFFVPLAQSQQGYQFCLFFFSVQKW